MRRKRKKSRGMLFPDLTPLIDVVFLLLIFFMVVTHFDKYSAFNLDLPKSGISTESKEKSYELIIDKNEKYFIKKDDKTEEISIETLTYKLSDAKDVSITADKDLKYEVIVKTIGKLKEIGIENVGMNFYE